MLRTRGGILGIAILLALIGDSSGKSRRQPPNNETTKAEQSAKPDQRGTPNQPLSVNVIPTAEQKTATEQEKANAELKAVDDRKLIKYTGYLVLVGVVQFLIFVLQLIAFGYQAYKLRQTVESSEKAIAVTRTIGEAQVRAYVSIKSAAIYFGGEAAMPFIDIVATNSGQSPALNFIWAPEVRYLPETTPEFISEPGEEWVAQPGIDIHSASESNGMYALTNFEMLEKIVVDGKMPERMGVSVIVHYAWRDVFGKNFIDSASFAGVAEIRDAAENQRALHALNTSPWACRLMRIAKGQAWSGILVKAPEKKTQGDPSPAETTVES
jgi:hypothetical protein